MEPLEIGDPISLSRWPRRVSERGLNRAHVPALLFAILGLAGLCALTLVRDQDLSRQIAELREAQSWREPSELARASSEQLELVSGNPYKTSTEQPRHRAQLDARAAIASSVSIASSYVYNFSAAHPAFGSIQISRQGPGSQAMVEITGVDGHAEMLGDLSKDQGVERDSRYYVTPSKVFCPTFCIECPDSHRLTRPGDFKCYLHIRDVYGDISSQVARELPDYACRDVHLSRKFQHTLWHGPRISAICTAPVRFMMMEDVEQRESNIWTVFQIHDNASTARPDDVMRAISSAASPENFEANIVLHRRAGMSGLRFIEPTCARGQETSLSCPGLAEEDYEPQFSSDFSFVVLLNMTWLHTAEELQSMALLSLTHSIHFHSLQVSQFVPPHQTDDNEDAGCDLEARCGADPRQGHEAYVSRPPFKAATSPCINHLALLHSGCKCEDAEVLQHGHKLAWCYVDSCEDCGPTANSSCSLRRRPWKPWAAPWAHCHGDGYGPNRPIDGICPTTHECTGRPYRGMQDNHMVGLNDTIGRPIRGFTTRVHNPTALTGSREFSRHPVKYLWCNPLGAYSRFLWSGLYTPGTADERFRHNIPLEESTFGVSTDLFFAHSVQDLHIKLDIQGYTAFDAGYLDGMIWLDLLQPYGSREMYPMSYGFLSLQRDFKTCLSHDATDAMRGLLPHIAHGDALFHLLTRLTFCMSLTNDRRIILSASVSFAGITLLGGEIHLASLHVKKMEDGSEQLEGVSMGDMQLSQRNETTHLHERHMPDSWELTKMIVQLDRERSVLTDRVSAVEAALQDHLSESEASGARRLQLRGLI